VAKGWVQGGSVEATVVLDPAAQDGVPHTRQIVDGLVAPQGDSPAPHLLSHPRRRSVAHGRSKAHKELPPPILRPTRPERVPKEIELLIGMPPRPIVILAVDDPRLLGMHFQSPVLESTLDARQYLLRLLLRLAVRDDIVGVPLERNSRVRLAHPLVMSTQTPLTPIYLVCFHSVTPETLSGASGQYLTVETAIRDGEWPYDNGDDPSFHVARRGGPLTWGVCRQKLRNAILAESIVVFFAFTPIADERIVYRFCAVATVVDKVDHRAIHRDRRFAKLRDRYINRLIVPENGEWRHDEEDRRRSARHKDWLWRIADHAGLTKEEFGAKYASIYRNESFSESAVTRRALRLGRNYVVFSTLSDHTFISSNPPRVAVAVKGQREKWLNLRLRAMTVGTAARLGGRDYLRVQNPSHRNVHPPIRFEMPTIKASRWRDALIAALEESSPGTAGDRARRSARGRR